jgi:hypothetical protein
MEPGLNGNLSLVEKLYSLNNLESWWSILEVPISNETFLGGGGGSPSQFCYMQGSLFKICVLMKSQGALEVCKWLMDCPVIFQFFLKFLTHAEYMRSYVFHVCALKSVIWWTNKCTLINMFKYILLLLLSTNMFQSLLWPSSGCHVTRIQLIYR